SASHIMEFFYEYLQDDELVNDMKEHFSLGVAKSFDGDKYNHPKYWTNPLESQLPIAPNMTIYSLYGVGKETEIGYVYKRINISNEASAAVPYQVDPTANRESENLMNGIQGGNGDGT